MDRNEIREELKARVLGRYYGHIPSDEGEAPREVQVKKLYLILAGAGCPSCEEALEEYKAEIDAGQIEVLDPENDDKAIEIVSKLGFYSLPALVAEDVEGDYMVVDNAS